MGRLLALPARMIRQRPATLVCAVVLALPCTSVVGDTQSWPEYLGGVSAAMSHDLNPHVSAVLAGSSPLRDVLQDHGDLYDRQVDALARAEEMRKGSSPRAAKTPRPDASGHLEVHVVDLSFVLLSSSVEEDVVQRAVVRLNEAFAGMRNRVGGASSSTEPRTGERPEAAFRFRAAVVRSGVAGSARASCDATGITWAFNLRTAMTYGLDPRHFINVFVCDMGGARGGSFTPSDPSLAAGHNIWLSADALKGAGAADAGADGGASTFVHEMGRALGLFPTQEGGCSSYGDGVDDTPAVGAAVGSRWPGCDSTGNDEGQRDSCPYESGTDDVRNFMGMRLPRARACALLLAHCPNPNISPRQPTTKTNAGSTSPRGR